MCCRKSLSRAIVLLGSVLPSVGTGSEPVTVTSPDGRLQFELQVETQEQTSGVPCYRVLRDGQPIVESSRLGLVLGAEHPSDLVLHGLAVNAVQTSRNNSTWQPVCGERSTVRDDYQQATIELGTAGDRPLRLALDVARTMRGSRSATVFHGSRDSSRFRSSAVALSFTSPETTRHGLSIPLRACTPKCRSARSSAVANAPLVVQAADGSVPGGGRSPVWSTSPV